MVKFLSIFLNTSFLILLSFFLAVNFLNPPLVTPAAYLATRTDDCTTLPEYPDHKSMCLYLKSNVDCRPKGYINYLEIFYCSCGRSPLLGYTLLILWLVLLFYILGNTASDYFCPSLESLSKVLNLSPAIAGTTLLPLGNGSPDVFSSIISFTRSGNGDIGLNSVLGGAFFISSIVVGVLSILISSRRVIVDRPSFVRDVLFLIFSLGCLLLIVLAGRIYLWMSLCFASIYILYIAVVSAMHFFNNKKQIVDDESPDSDEVEETRVPLLGFVDDEKYALAEKGVFKDFDVGSSRNVLVSSKPKRGLRLYFSLFLHSLEFPLYLPRRITIPVVSKDKWSKPYAVISVTLAPNLLAVLWNTQKEPMGSTTSLIIYMAAGIFGVALGSFAFLTTNSFRPPQKSLLLWLAGGFFMSITWTYIIAEELVSLLASLGTIMGISSSILGLTVLAWGNSIGDLIANVAMALHGGPDGAQIAISGCYAGPIFNLLVGLGMSLVFQSVSQYPSPYLVPNNDYLYETLAFIMAGLLWALVILHKKNMQLDRTLGVGLLAMYFCFLFIKISRALGLLNLSGSSLLSLRDEAFSFRL